MQKALGTRTTFLAYTSFVALCSLVILGGMLFSPSEAGHSILFGLSLPRLILAMGLTLAFLFFLYLFIKSYSDRHWAEKIFQQWFDGGTLSQVTAWLAGISLGLGWIGSFLPAYRAGIFSSYWNRIQPLMIFILCFGLATAIVLLIWRIEFPFSNPDAPGLYRLAVSLFAASLVLFGFVLFSKYGLSAPDEDFWYGAGVPILTLQWIGAILAGALFLLLARKISSKRFDIAVFILLYLGTAALWAREPLQKSFLFTEPRSPNQELYPFADSAAFDAGSQFALIGQGIYIFNSPFNDRPLYLSLLVYLHSLFGQNYELLMAAQAAIFAILPGLIYLIGRSLNMRAVGFAAGITATLRGINSIAGSSMIDMANPKMILSDFPAAIGVALIILFACEWLKKPELRWQYAIWTGGAIGLTLMIRPHALVILVFLPFLALLGFAPHWKSWMIACTLLVLGVVAITLPWELRNVARGGIMYRSIVVKVQDVIRSRYTAPPDGGSFAPSDKNLSAFTFQTTRVLSSLQQGSETLQPCSSILCFTPKHFLHNTVMSILVLPTSPILDDLRHLVKGDQTVWRADWQGNFSPASPFFIAVNIFFIVLGISVAWKVQGLTGLVPLAVFVMYNISNAAARTSGGRYIVPSDWIIPLYFMAGILFLFKEIAAATFQKLFFSREPESAVEATTHHPRSPLLTTGLLLGCLFAIGLVVPLSEKLYSPRYANMDRSKILQEHESQIAEAGLTPDQINKFLSTPGAELLFGRTLFPRSYKLGQGEVTFYFYPFTVMDFPRTGFFLIGPHGQDNILLPGGIPDYLPHAVDALVVGCREENYVDALLVIVLGEPESVSTRWPMAELSCPMKPPVCENNTVCQ